MSTCSFSGRVEVVLPAWLERSNAGSLVGAVVAPAGHRVPGAATLAAGQHLRAGAIEVIVGDGGPPIVVEVRV